jgi:hypothetical protein
VTDWTELPEGHYAIPIHHDDTLIGYATYRRSTTRSGREQFRRGVALAVPGHEDTLRSELDAQAATLAAHVAADIGTLLADSDRYRLLYGTFVGRCGWCGRKLTDKTSLLLGIGPDCRAGMGWADGDVPTSSPTGDPTALRLPSHWTGRCAEGCTGHPDGDPTP